MVDYRKLRPSNITSPEFRHLLLLLYWPIYGLTFLILERGLTLSYYPVESALDAKIPFCEYFVPAYYFWFVFLIGIHVYTGFFDIPAFKKLMYFIIITYTVTSVIYILYPTKQELRPAEFARDNIFVMIVKGLYDFDTNTNVCPSIHCLGAMAVAFAAWDTERFHKPLWKAAFFAMALLISVSTVFVKQHSAVDVLSAWALCAVGYVFVYRLLPKGEKSGVQKWQEQTII